MHMCGRYTYTQSLNQLEIVLPEGVELAWQARYNIAPGQYAPVIPQYDPEHIHLFRWGLVPGWARDEKLGFKMINARSETVDQKPAFRNAFKHRRCLVLADSFYEWKKTPQGKVPYRFVWKKENPFYFAGLYEKWEKGSVPLETYTILTTEPNALTGTVHDRMPVILETEALAIWMDPQASPEDLKAWLRPIDAEFMEGYPVSPKVGNVKNDYPELIRRQDIPGDLFT